MRVEIKKEYKNGYSDVEETKKLDLSFEIEELLNLKHMSPEGNDLSTKIITKLLKELD